MAGGKAVTPYDTVDTSNQISLKQFSPLLRKVGKYILENDDPKTISEAIRDLKLNEMSVWNTITRNRKNGNDFTVFIDQQAKMLLHVNKIAVYRKTLDRAVSNEPSGYQDRRTFLQLAGDLQESKVNLNVNVLTVGYNINPLPADNDRDKGTIKIDPFIPGSKR